MSPAHTARCARHLSRLALTHSFPTLPRRCYATHSLDTQRPLSRNTIGPFQLGISQDTLRQGKKPKKWSELTSGGKVLRTTERSTNLIVILLGAGLSALLIYSLTTELFSKNSPTVLYNDACERIKASPKMTKYMNGPLTFHNNPPLTYRPRHRNRHVTSQVMVDIHGNEHMILTFYVQGKPEGWMPPSSEMSILEITHAWTRDKYENLSNFKLDESLEWSKDQVEAALEKLKDLFRYLSGMEKPVLPPIPPAVQEAANVQRKNERGAWNFAGIFSSLRGSKRTSREAVRSGGQIFTDGEVHADLIRNEQGYFVFRYLLVDLPSTGHPNPVRVFIERTPGVRDNESVMRWSSFS
ncbi:hypothetical protein APHAL10511_006501 [Amanita phalloides]|nr:hypothetical protein APHAL10511_006501 [Amanita phalloides]